MADSLPQKFRIGDKVRVRQDGSALSDWFSDLAGVELTIIGARVDKQFAEGLSYAVSDRPGGSGTYGVAESWLEAVEIAGPSTQAAALYAAGARAGLDAAAKEIKRQAAIVIDEFGLMDQLAGSVQLLPLPTMPKEALCIPGPITSMVADPRNPEAGA